MNYRCFSIVMAFALLLAGTGHAANSVDVIWTATTGSGTTGGTTIEAQNGDILTAEVRLTVDAGGVQIYLLSAQFDTSLEDEFDLVSAVASTPPPPLSACGSITTQESSGSQLGQVRGFCGLYFGAGPTNTSFPIGVIELEVKNVASDGFDLTPLAINSPAEDAIFDNTTTDVTPSTTFNSATVQAYPPRVPFAADDVIAMTGVLPTDVLAADIDGDGDLDVLRGSCIDETVAWDENDGASPPSFTERIITTGTAGCISDVNAADLDGDGDLDVLSTSDDAGLVLWYENDGTPAVGSWTARSIDTRVGAYEGLATDVDGDGDLDVVAAFAGGTNDVAWYRNDGGSPLVFNTRPDIATGGLYLSLDAGDLDSDGVVDIVSSGNGGVLGWHENVNGDGSSWTNRSLTHTGTGTWSTRIADIDGDGAMDIVSISSGDDLVAWYESDGSTPPSFTERVITDSGFADSPQKAIAADVDGDGDIDVLSVSSTDDTVAWYENLLGDGTSWSEWVISTSVDAFPDNGLFAADLDGDGDLDVLSSDAGDDEIAWHENLTIHRSAHFPTEVALTSGATETRLVFGDLDGDADLDQVVTRLGDGEVVWLENDNGDASSWTENTIATGESGPFSVRVSDLDRDGDLDVVVGLGSGGAIVWYENDGGGGTWTRKVAYTTGSVVNHIEIGDIDADGDPDVVSGLRADDEINWIQNDGDPSDDVGEWTDTVITSSLLDVGGISVGDVDGDGDLDVVGTSALGSPTDEVRWYENDGSPLGPSWSSVLIDNDDQGGRRPALGDIDGDGDLDVAAPFDGSDSVRWYANSNSDGTSWKAHYVRNDSIDPTFAHLWDVDEDGDLDAVVGTHDVQWFENDGAGSHWDGHSISALSDTFWSVGGGDLDGDGDIDVAAAGATDQRIRFHENQGGQFALPTTGSSYLGMVDGQSHEVLRIDAIHRGRSLDTDVELASIEFEVQDDLGAVVQNQHVITRFEEFELWLDDGSGELEPGSDTSVASIDPNLGGGTTPSTYTIAFADLDPDVALSEGSPKLYFLTAEMKVTASSGTGASSLELVHVTESTPTAEDRDHDSPLSFEGQADTGSGVFQVLSTAGDSDGDGLSNALELANGSDALNSDTDGDGLLDGVETNTGLFNGSDDTGTDPTVADTDGDGLSDGAETNGLAGNPILADTDIDGVCDGGQIVGALCSTAGPDNCPFVSNPGQANSDTASQGDDCQCGNVDSTGGITGNDLLLVRQYLVNGTMPVEGTLEDCNVTGPYSSGIDDCTVTDSFLIQRVSLGAAATLGNQCEVYGGPPDSGCVDMCGPVCGNGGLEIGEECDDGDLDPGDGCDGSCLFDATCDLDPIFMLVYLCSNQSGIDCTSTACPTGEECVYVPAPVDGNYCLRGCVTRADCVY